MYPGYRGASPDRVRATLDYLKLCRQARAAGYVAHSLTQDPEWLVDMAINRRAGWPDDPTTARGSAMPVGGKFPKRAAGDYYGRWLCQLAWKVNTPRLVVRETEVPRWLRPKLAHRLSYD